MVEFSTALVVALKIIALNLILGIIIAIVVLSSPITGIVVALIVSPFALAIAVFFILEEVDNMIGAREREVVKKSAREYEVLDPRREHALAEKLSLSKKFIFPEKALKGLIEQKLSQGKTREQALKEIEEEFS